ncbi:hypothetical protein [Oceanibium sediminis]|uniref:hypothetical protein n=1 Tax=Oceanibium sediminis TaxID=2026339 RepID=UPI000DD4A577|nr:hypothetical protein [Oceanibium sediminis]
MTKLRHLGALAAPLLLLACATPQERCLDSARANVTGLQTAIAIAEANIARGFALDRQVVPQSRLTFCTGTGFGERVRVGLNTCRETRYRTVSTPVPLDIEAEQRKLESMRERLPTAIAERDRAVAACLAQVPG